MANPKVADVLVDTLHALGVHRIYGVVGDSLNAITDAIRRKNTIEWIHTRHEEAAALAAGAEAQLTGNLAVCAGSCGPGNIHLINGLYDSHRSHAPVLALAAHIPTPEIGGDYFQETHPQILFKECSYFCELVSDPEQMPRMLAIAIQTALSRRGVAVLVIPGDIASKLAKDNNPALWPRAPQPRMLPSENELQKISDILNSSKRVTLLCGSGCEDAREEVMALAQRLQSPMVHTLRGKAFLEYDNPYDVGMTGFIGFSSGYYAIEDCDTLLMLGTSFPYRQFYPKNAKVIQIDLLGENLGKRCSIAMGAVGDIKNTIPALLPLLDQKEDSSHLETAKNHYKKARKSLDDLAVRQSDNKKIHPQYLAKVIDQVAAEDTVFSCDVGTVTVWAARYLHMNGRRRLLGSFNHGSMATALSQAIGAQATYPDRQIVALCGDGGLAMLMGDLITLKQQNLPIKVIVFNNGTLGFVELEMKSAGLIEFGTELQNPNFAALANSMGIHGVRVEKCSLLEDGLQEAMSYDGPALVDVVTNKLELIMPPKLNVEQIKGFSLYVTRAIINGRGDEVFELARSNLWR